jgi:hypothetical protein
MGRDAERRSLAPAVALLACGLFACAGTPGSDATGPVQTRTLLLAPLSFNQNLPERLEPGVEVVSREIRAQLEQRGIEVRTPPFGEFHDAWLVAAREVGSLYDDEGEFIGERFDAAVRNLAVAWRAREGDFDVLLLGYLLFRPGTVTGQSVQWDGVARRLPIEYVHRDAQHLEARRRFQAPCTSLRILGFDRDGNRLFERYGGLEVTAQAVLGEGRWGWRPRSDLFTDRTAMREGVRAALEPLLD